MDSFRKAYGALKDSTQVGLAKVNSEFKDLDVAIVKATSHVELPPKERHVRKIFAATSVARPRADVAYCIYALSRRLAKTRSWIVAIKTLIVVHRTLREGDPTFKEELLNFSQRGHIFPLSNFKDDSGPGAWDCSTWVRAYALFLEERLECFRTLKYDIEAERMPKTSHNVHGEGKIHARTRFLSGEGLLDQLPALQQLLYRLIGCQPEGAACFNFLIQYALALVLKESFKIYCAINDGIINLVDLFFEMSKHDAVKALNIYKCAGQQAANLADFYHFCKGLDLARTFQFPVLRQPPPSFLATMEEYIKEAPHIGSVSNKRLEYYQEEEEEIEEPVEEEYEKVVEEVETIEEMKPEEDEQCPKPVEESPLILMEQNFDLLGTQVDLDPKVAELEQSNALALAIIQPGDENHSTGNLFDDIGNSSGWELALVNAPSNHNNVQLAPHQKMGGGFDKLLLDSLYEDENARRQIQLRNAGYYNGGAEYGYEYGMQNPFFIQNDPFAMSNNIAPPTNVQLALMAQQQQQQQQQQHMMHQEHHQQQHMMMSMSMSMVPYNNQQYPQQQIPSSSNPFGDPFGYPPSNMQPGNHPLI